MNRNLQFARSFAFGILAKAAGSMVVFVGLPVIAHALAPSDYSVFLRSMSAASFGTLLFGAASTLAVRSLASALGRSREDVTEAERETVTLFVVTFAITVTLTLAALLFLPDRSGDLYVILAATALSLVQGFLVWGDTYQVAARVDYLSSLWQLVGAALTIIGILLLAHAGLWSTTIAYFGIPIVTQVLIVAQVWRDRRPSLRPTLHLGLIRKQLAGLFPIVTLSLADYAKIFLSGLVLGHLAGDASYVRYTTIVLFLVRMANPLTLITRPAMPALIDAMQAGDLAWLRRAAAVMMLAIVGSLSAVIALGTVMDPALVRFILPKGQPVPGTAEVLLAGLFFWGHAIVNLLAPVYYALHRAGVFATVATALVALGIAAGAVLTVAGFPLAMLASMAFSVAVQAMGLGVAGALALRSVSPAAAAGNG